MFAVRYARHAAALHLSVDDPPAWADMRLRVDASWKLVLDILLPPQASGNFDCLIFLPDFLIPCPFYLKLLTGKDSNLPSSFTGP